MFLQPRASILSSERTKGERICHEVGSRLKLCAGSSLDFVVAPSSSVLLDRNYELRRAANAGCLRFFIKARAVPTPKKRKLPAIANRPPGAMRMTPTNKFPGPASPTRTALVSRISSHRPRKTFASTHARITSDPAVQGSHIGKSERTNTMA
jgi:hypothetical protein